MWINNWNGWSNRFHKWTEIEQFPFVFTFLLSLLFKGNLKGNVCLTKEMFAKIILLEKGAKVIKRQNYKWLMLLNTKLSPIKIFGKQIIKYFIFDSTPLFFLFFFGRNLCLTKKKLYMKYIHVLFFLFSIFFFKMRMEIDSTKISMLEVEVVIWFSKLCMAESIHNNFFSFFFFLMGEDIGYRTRDFFRWKVSASSVYYLMCPKALGSSQVLN